MSCLRVSGHTAFTIDFELGAQTMNTRRQKGAFETLFTTVLRAPVAIGGIPWVC